MLYLCYIHGHEETCAHHGSNTMVRLDYSGLVDRRGLNTKYTQTPPPKKNDGTHAEIQANGRQRESTVECG
jgi:hypothetical protein